MNSGSSMPVKEFDLHYAQEQLRRSRNPLRRFVKAFYLRHILRDVRGPTIDFGCGAGQLLKRLPKGSIGLEVNPHLIESLRCTGLQVHQARAEIQDFNLPDCLVGAHKTLIIAHVLEHLPDPASALLTLLAACHRLGIERVIVVVPGIKGFAADRTHKTFVDSSYLETRIPQISSGFTRNRPSYFPGPWASLGRMFTFHEMKVVFDRIDENG